MVEATEQLYLDLLARKTFSPRSAAAVPGRPERLAQGSPRVSDAVDVVTEPEDFRALEAEWNDAVDRAGLTHPFLSHEWMRIWWESFGAGRALHVIVTRSGGRITAIAPFVRETVRMYGTPMRQIRMMQNDHTPRADVIVAEDGDRAYRAIWRTLQQTRDRWDVLLLSALARESRTREIVAAFAGEARQSIGTWQSDASPYVELAGSWRDYYASLPGKFRQNLRNRLGRLTKLGTPALEVLRDRGAIEAACGDALRLEASGWKTGAGTSVCSDESVRRFYTALIEPATARGWLRLLFLTVDGRRIATAYSAVYRRRLFLFKTGYDPEYATCSPFKLLTYFALQHAFDEGWAELDFLGDAEPWKLEWTSTVRPHDWLFVFSGTPRARIVHPIKFQLVPALKRLRAS